MAQRPKSRTSPSRFRSPSRDAAKPERMASGRFQDWLRNQQTLEIAGDLVQQSASLDALMGSVPFSQRLATRVATPLLGGRGRNVEKRWHRTQQLLKELSRLRRNDIQYCKTEIPETSRHRARSGSTRTSREWKNSAGRRSRLNRSHPANRQIQGNPNFDKIKQSVRCTVPDILKNPVSAIQYLSHLCGKSYFPNPNFALLSTPQCQSGS